MCSLSSRQLFAIDEDSEVWRDVKGYEGLYQVSNRGRIRSLDRISIDKNSFPKNLKGRLKTPSESNGYYSLPLYSGRDNYRNFLVHRLVAEAFVENPDPSTKTQVNHIDGNTRNNNASNLEWVTPSENIQHAHKLGLFDKEGATRNYKKMGELSGLKRRRSVLCLDTGIVYPSLKDAAADLKITIDAVFASCQDGRPHRGFTFRYCDSLKVDKSGNFIVPDDPIKQSKHLSSPVFCVELNKVFKSRMEAARCLGISDSSVRDSIRDGRSHCGYTFRNVT